MIDVVDDLSRQAHLTEALEAHFGPCDAWSLKVKAACCQLRTLNQLTDDTTYGEFLHCANEAFRLKDESTLAVPRPYSTYLARTLDEAYGAEPSDTADLMWAFVLGLEILLSGEHFETVMRAAHYAWDMALAAERPLAAG